MEEIYDRQKAQDDLQRSEEFVDVFSKIVSGKSGYKTIVSVKPMTTECKSCNVKLDIKQKFCHECGAKNDASAGQK